MNVEKIYREAKNNSVYSLRREYEWDKALTISFMVAFILNSFNTMRNLAINGIESIFFDFSIVIIIGIMMVLFIWKTKESLLILIINEEKMYKSKRKTLNFIEEYLNAF